MDSQIHLQQNGFIPEQQRIAIQDMGSNGETKEECLLEGAVVKEESPGRN